jgi:hypothetical protein
MERLYLLFTVDGKRLFLEFGRTNDDSSTELLAQNTPNGSQSSFNRHQQPPQAQWQTLPFGWMLDGKDTP